MKSNYVNNSLLSIHKLNLSLHTFAIDSRFVRFVHPQLEQPEQWEMKMRIFTCRHGEMMMMLNVLRNIIASAHGFVCGVRRANAPMTLFGTFQAEQSASLFLRTFSVHRMSNFSASPNAFCRRSWKIEIKAEQIYKSRNREEKATTIVNNIFISRRTKWCLFELKGKLLFCLMSFNDLCDSFESDEHCKDFDLQAMSRFSFWLLLVPNKQVCLR